MYFKSSNLIGPLPLNNFSYSTPTIAHAHKVIKCHLKRIWLETAVAEWSRTLAINARVVGSNPGNWLFFSHLLK